MRCISVLMYLYFRNFPASVLITLQALTVARHINVHVPFTLLRIMVSGLLLGMVLSVLIGWFHNMVTLPSWFVSPDFGTYSYQCSLSTFTPISLRMVKCLYYYYYYYYYYCSYLFLYWILLLWTCFKVLSQYWLCMSVLLDITNRFYIVAIFVIVGWQLIFIT